MKEWQIDNISCVPRFSVVPQIPQYYFLAPDRIEIWPKPPNRRNAINIESTKDEDVALAYAYRQHGHLFYRVYVK